MYVHGVSGEVGVTRIVIQYFPQYQGPVLEMNRNREVGVLLVCRQVLQ